MFFIFESFVFRLWHAFALTGTNRLPLSIAADIPSLFPNLNLLDLPINRVLPMPMSGSPSLMNVGASHTPYLRDLDMVASSGLSFVPGEEESANLYSAGSSKSLSSMPGTDKLASYSPSTTTGPLSNAFGDVSSPESNKLDILASSPHHQNYVISYTDDSLETLPIASSSSAFTRFGTADSSSSDTEEPLMMSMGGLKTDPENGDKKFDYDYSYKPPYTMHAYKSQGHQDRRIS